jgi:hypothetical protein
VLGNSGLKLISLQPTGVMGVLPTNYNLSVAEICVSACDWMAELNVSAAVLIWVKFRLSALLPVAKM